MASQQAAQCPLAVPLATNVRRIEEINAGFDCGLKCGLDLAHWRAGLLIDPTLLQPTPSTETRTPVSERSQYHRSSPHHATVHERIWPSIPRAHGRLLTRSPIYQGSNAEVEAFSELQTCLIRGRAFENRGQAAQRLYQYDAPIEIVASFGQKTVRAALRRSAVSGKERHQQTAGERLRP